MMLNYAMPLRDRPKIMFVFSSFFTTLIRSARSQLVHFPNDIKIFDFFFLLHSRPHLLTPCHAAVLTLLFFFPNFISFSAALFYFRIKSQKEKKNVKWMTKNKKNYFYSPRQDSPLTSAIHSSSQPFTLLHIFHNKNYNFIYILCFF